MSYKTIPDAICSASFKADFSVKRAEKWNRHRVYPGAEFNAICQQAALNGEPAVLAMKFSEVFKGGKSEFRAWLSDVHRVAYLRDASHATDRKGRRGEGLDDMTAVVGVFAEMLFMKCGGVLEAPLFVPAGTLQEHRCSDGDTEMFEIKAATGLGFDERECVKATVALAGKSFYDKLAGDAFEGFLTLAVHGDGSGPEGNWILWCWVPWELAAAGRPRKGRGGRPSEWFLSVPLGIPADDDGLRRRTFSHLVDGFVAYKEMQNARGGKVAARAAAAVMS